MIADIIIVALILVAAFFSIKYTRKHGSCDCGTPGGCSSCSGHCDPKEHAEEMKKLQEFRRRKAKETVTQ